MTQTQWLIQSNHPRFAPAGETEALIRDLGRQAFCIAIGRDKTRFIFPDDLRLEAPIICYGPSFVPHALGWKAARPGIFFDPSTFCWSAFQAGWRDRMLNRDTEIITAGDFLRRPQTRISVFSRPDLDSKAFDGAAYDTEKLRQELEAAIIAGRMEQDTRIVLASVQEIECEWRIFIVGTNVVGASSYRRAGRADIDAPVPHCVIDFAFEAAEQWTPHDVFCLDIGQANGRLGIIEANCFNASRLYGVPAEPIFRAVSELVEANFQAGA